ncbi:MAG: AIR synthase-related protein [Candidatus Syntropharchaeia archaeon]
MDLEGYAKRALRKNADLNSEDLAKKLAERILEIKDISEEKALNLANSVIMECKATLNPKDDLLRFHESGITMGEFGVGSRGEGDFYTHKKIAEVIGKTGAVVDSTELDDSGVVKANSSFIVVTVDGIHSRLSDFPFIAGFHVTRAALRDIYVMGATPVAIFSDIHLADDGDVSKIFDHIAGISCVSELSGVPFITGSTLRIGGDMVIGERMSGCVGAVGISNEIALRRNAEIGDVILMTEGAGGGTVSTTALYYGEHDVVRETLNIKFLEACKALIEGGIVKEIHAMTDVTNGGIRGDANEIAKVAGVKLVFYEEKIRDLVNERVLALLERHEIDYLGVSIDALLIISPEDAADDIKKIVRSKNIKIDEIGRVEEGKGAEIVINGKREKFVPKFRESAYTPIKKVVGEEAGRDFEEMRRRIDEAARKAIEKKKKVIEIVKAQG